MLGRGGTLLLVGLACCLSFSYGVLVGTRQFFPYRILLATKDAALTPPGDPLADRIAVEASVLAGRRNMVALAFGQSNAANHGEAPHVPRQGVYNLFRGTLFVARDPLLGASGTGGSIWSRLGERLIDAGRYDNVVLVTIAEGGSEIRRWAPGGDLHPRLVRVLRHARDPGPSITHLLWQQGETDASLGTAAETYRQLFREMTAGVREEGCLAPIFVATATRGAGRPPHPGIRAAQRSLVDLAAGIFAGPDTDALGYAYRYDGRHFTGEGLDVAADLWLRCLTGDIGRP